MKNNNKKGFTLVELVIVVAVMAILVAVAIPTVASITDSATKSVNNSNARAIESVVKLYEAGVAAGTTTADSLEKAVNDAKLGIVKAEGSKTAYEFKLDESKGIVSWGTSASGNCTITFDEKGDAKVTGYVGSTTTNKKT